MKNFILFVVTITIAACSEKNTQEPNQSFEDFQTEYFNARQGDELDEACTSWYDDCVAAGYPEESCSTRLEYCQDEERSDEDRESDESDEGNSECQREARIAYQECIDAGSSEEDCRNEYAQAYNDCENNR